MATERITIVVEEKGTRVVKRRIGDIGDSATLSAKGVDLLKRSLVTLGAGYVVRELIRTADAFTNLQNRLRLATSGTAELNAVTRELLAISNRTRTSLEDNAELFNRVALSVREMGISQQDVLNFTESLNQAILISGANAQEARMGIIQLSQALASGRLQGDELRSVMEQLRAVSQVIANELGVTRGELKKMGEEGKISSEIIVKAFMNAREELAERFTKVIPTVGQAWQVLRNSVVAYIGEANTAIGATQSLSRVMIVLANNLDIVIRSAIVLGATFAAIKMAPFVQQTILASAAWYKFHRTIAMGNAVLLGSAEATRQQAAAQVAAAAADLQKTQAVLANVRAEMARAVVVRGSTEALFAQAAMETQVALLEKQLVTQHAALTAAQTNLRRATRAVRIEGTLFGRTLKVIRGGIHSLTAAIAANPVGALLVALTAATTLLVVFSDKIKLAEGSSVTLRDVGVAAFAEYQDIIGGCMLALKQWVAEFEPLRQAVISVFGDINFNMNSFLHAAAKVADSFVGFFVGSFYALGRLFQQFPNLIISALLAAVNGAIALIEGLINGAISAINFLVQKAENLINSLIRSVNKVIDIIPGIDKALSEISLGKIETVDLGRIENDLGQAATDFSNAIIGGFEEGFTRIHGVQDLLDRAIARAEAAAAKQGEGPDLATAAAGGAPAAETGKSPAEKALEKQIEEQQQLQKLLRMTNEQREVENELIKITDKLTREKITLTDAQKDQLRVELERTQLLEQVAGALDEVRGVTIDLTAAQAELNSQVARHVITQEQATQAYRKLQDQMLQSSTTAEAGWTRGLNRIVDKVNDTGAAVEDTLVNAFNSAEDALVEFVQTGEFNFSSLVDSILADLTRLLARQAISGLIGMIGGPAGMLGGLFASAATSRQGGGPVTPGHGYWVGEKGPEPFIPDRPGHIVPAQQAAAAAAPEVNVHITNVTDPNEVAGALATPDGEKAVLNIIHRNRRAIQGIS